MKTPHFSIVGDSIRLHTQARAGEVIDDVDVELGRINSDCTPVLPRTPDRINDELVVSMGCPKLDSPPVTADDLSACREWLDQQGFTTVHRTN